MNLHQLEVFEAIMRTGTVSEAARSLNVSQPAVSKSLRLAEQAAGFILFRRVAGRLYPSREAEALLPQAQHLRNEINATALLVRQLREGLAGQVVVASVASLGHAFITPAVLEFSRANPDVRIEVKLLPTFQVADLVAQSHADFGLVHEPVANPYINGENICLGEATCFVRRDHPLAGRRTLGPRDLQGTPLLCYREDTGIGSHVRRAIANAGLRRQVDIVINQSEQGLDLAERGAGIAIGEPFLLIARPRASLVAIPFRPIVPFHLRLIRARERPRSRAAGQLERAVRASIVKGLRKSMYAVKVASR
ncbi:MAG: LysR family transcriptional regulator [Rhodoferax sp.]|nr:LysR family transcriptional regulator [Rhodoferax sp.]